MKRLLLGLLIVVVVTMLGLASLATSAPASFGSWIVPPASAGGWMPPAPSVGGCKEAYIAPQSDAADACRDRGWTIAVGERGRGIIVSPSNVVRYLWLPQCRYEDGSGQRSACTWNMVLPYQGNGMGKALWIDRKDRIHFVKRTLANP